MYGILLSFDVTESCVWLVQKNKRSQRGITFEEHAIENIPLKNTYVRHGTGESKREKKPRNNEILVKTKSKNEKLTVKQTYQNTGAT